jgi:hypothetical protein
MSELKTKGRLTAYAFACGYLEQTERKSRRVQLYHEHGTYHVRGFDFAQHERICWECFDSLTQARRYYDKQAKAI